MKGGHTIRPLVGDRIVWGGRWTPNVPGALDGWSCDHAALMHAMDRAAELIVLDALSFPWDSMRAKDRAIPLVVALPHEFDGPAIDQVFGPLLLRHLTPFDQLMEHRSEVRAHLSARWGFADEAWLAVDSPGGAQEVCATLEARSEDRLIDVVTDTGVYRAQKDDLLTHQLHDFGAHQRGTLNVLLALLEPDDVVLDVGAHIGTFTIPLARRLGSSGLVFSVEGMRENRGLLELNVRKNAVEDRVTIVPEVVGAPGGRAYVAEARFGNTGSSVFAPASWRGLGSQDAVTLDNLMLSFPDLRRTTILKMDIEGAEFDALLGCEALVAAARPALLLEISPAHLRRRGVSPGAIAQWLVDHDYRLLVVAGERNTRGAAWELRPVERLDETSDVLFDVLALPRESARFDALALRGSVD